MKIGKSLLNRATCLGVASIFFFSQVLFAQQIQKSFWDERKEVSHNMNGTESQTLLAQLSDATTIRHSIAEHNLSSPNSSLSTAILQDIDLKKFGVTQNLAQLSHIVAILSSKGTVRQIQPASDKSAPILVYIQDVHGREAPQRNISAMILELLEQFPNALVGLEGASGKIDLKPLRGPHTKVNKDVGSFFFNKGYIGGPEYAAFAAPKEPHFLGLENKELYLKNVEAVRKCLAQQPLLVNGIKILKWQINQKKHSIYSPLMKELDAKAQKHDEGVLPLREYLSYLGSIGKNSDFSSYPNISLFLKTWRIESSLDFTKVEQERNRILSCLVETQDKSKLERLVERSIAFRLGYITYADYYKILKETVIKAGLNLEKFPHFDRYIHYVLQADTIHTETLFTEIYNLEKAAWQSLLETPQQKELYRIASNFNILEKMITLNLTTNDWVDYHAAQKDIHRLPGRIKNAEFYVYLQKINNFATAIKDFELFYEFAEARNEALASNIMEAIKKNETAPMAIMVAGGFHTRGLTQLLAKKVTMVTVSPKLDQADPKKGSEYLSVFTRSKLPLEKLFESPKITIADNLAIQPYPELKPDTVHSVGPEIGGVLAALEKLEPGQPLGEFGTRPGVFTDGKSAIGFFEGQGNVPPHAISVHHESEATVPSGFVGVEGGTTDDGFNIAISVADDSEPGDFLAPKTRRGFLATSGKVGLVLAVKSLLGKLGIPLQAERMASAQDYNARKLKSKTASGKLTPVFEDKKYEYVYDPESGTERVKRPGDFYKDFGRKLGVFPSAFVTSAIKLSQDVRKGIELEHNVPNFRKMVEKTIAYLEQKTSRSPEENKVLAYFKMVDYVLHKTGLSGTFEKQLNEARRLGEQEQIRIQLQTEKEIMDYLLASPQKDLLVYFMPHFAGEGNEAFQAAIGDVAKAQGFYGENAVLAAYYRAFQLIAGITFPVDKPGKTYPPGQGPAMPVERSLKIGLTFLRAIYHANAAKHLRTEQEYLSDTGPENYTANLTRMLSEQHPLLMQAITGTGDLNDFIKNNKDRLIPLLASEPYVGKTPAETKINIAGVPVDFFETGRPSGFTPLSLIAAMDGQIIQKAGNAKTREFIWNIKKRRNITKADIPGFIKTGAANLDWVGDMFEEMADREMDQLTPVEQVYKAGGMALKTSKEKHSPEAYAFNRMVLNSDYVLLAAQGVKARQRASARQTMRTRGGFSIEPEGPTPEIYVAALPKVYSVLHTALTNQSDFLRKYYGRLLSTTPYEVRDKIEEGLAKLDDLSDIFMSLYEETKTYKGNEPEQLVLIKDKNLAKKIFDQWAETGEMANANPAMFPAMEIGVNDKDTGFTYQGQVMFFVGGGLQAKVQTVDGKDVPVALYHVGRMVKTGGETVTTAEHTLKINNPDNARAYETDEGMKRLYSAELVETYNPLDKPGQKPAKHSQTPSSEKLKGENISWKKGPAHGSGHVYISETGGTTLAGFKRVEANKFISDKLTVTVTGKIELDDGKLQLDNKGRNMPYNEINVHIEGNWSGNPIGATNVQNVEIIAKSVKALTSEGEKIRIPAGTAIITHYEEKELKVARTLVFPTGELVPIDIEDEFMHAVNILESDVEGVNGLEKHFLSKGNMTTSYTYNGVVIARYRNNVPSIYNGRIVDGKLRFYTSSGELLTIDIRGNITTPSTGGSWLGYGFYKRWIAPLETPLAIVLGVYFFGTQGVLAGLFAATFFWSPHLLLNPFTFGNKGAYKNRDVFLLTVLTFSVGALASFFPLFIGVTATTLLTVTHFYLNNPSFRVLLADMLLFIRNKRFSVTISNYTQHVKEGYDFIQKTLNQDSPLSDDEKYELAEFLIAISGDIQDNLTSGFDASAPLSQNSSIKDWIKTALNKSTTKKFLAQIYEARRTSQKGKLPEKEFRNLAYLAGRLGIKEKTTQNVITALAKAMNITKPVNSWKADWQKGRLKSNPAKYEIIPSYTSQDNRLAANETEKPQVTALYLNPLEYLDNDTDKDILEEAQITAEHAVRLIQTMQSDEYKAFVVKIPASEQPNKSKADWTNRVFSMGRHYGLSEDMIRQVKIVFVESDNLLTKNVILDQALETFGLANSSNVQELRDSYSLGLYTATTKGLNMNDLANYLFWLIGGNRAIPVLKLLNQEEKKDKVYTSQA